MHTDRPSTRAAWGARLVARIGRAGKLIALSKLIVDQVVDSSVADQQMPAKEGLFGL